MSYLKLPFDHSSPFGLFSFGSSFDHRPRRVFYCTQSPAKRKNPNIWSSSMEGTQCQEKGCKTCDLLPFTCRYCQKQYCLSHRSKFNHQCRDEDGNRVVPASAPAPEQAPTSQTFQDKMEGIHARHDDSGLNEMGSTKLHHNVAGSALSDADRTDEAFSQKLAGIEQRRDYASARGDARKTSISEKTRFLLIKQKAEGNSAVNVQDRFFLAVNFEATGQMKHVFFKRSSALGEVLESWCKAFPKLAFGQPLRPDGMSLVLVGGETWDRSSPLADFVQEFSDVTVASKSTAEVVAMQAAHEKASSNLLEQSMAPSSSSCAPGSSMPTSSSSGLPPSPTLQRDFVKGEGVIYTGQDGNSFKAVITGVHLDDPPDTYYTIRYGEHERQTVAKRLTLDPSAAPPAPTPTPPRPTPAAASPPGTVSFKVALGAKMAEVRNFSETKTVADLKKYISEKIKLPVKSQKLACKGQILKDHMKISDTKISEGSRVTLMSRDANSSSCVST